MGNCHDIWALKGPAKKKIFGSFTNIKSSLPKIRRGRKWLIYSLEFGRIFNEASMVDTGFRQCKVNAIDWKW